jgi:hypothetical protein
MKQTLRVLANYLAICCVLLSFNVLAKPTNPPVVLPEGCVNEQQRTSTQAKVGGFSTPPNGASMFAMKHLGRSQLQGRLSVPNSEIEWSINDGKHWKNVGATSQKGKGDDEQRLIVNLSGETLRIEHLYLRAEIKNEDRQKFVMCKYVNTFVEVIAAKEIQ